MHKSNSDTPWLSVTLDRAQGVSLQAQLCSEIRRLVHQGRMASGDRLPSSRLLAQELSVSRVTVVTAYDQLVSEGYIAGQRGAGMFVAPELSALPRPPDGPRRVSLPPPPEPFVPFDTAAPAMLEFPHRQWAKLLEQVWRDPEPALLARPDPLGWGPLRVAISEHLRGWRGINCEPAQVIVTSGLGESVALFAAVTLRDGDQVCVEEPGHGLLRAALESNGLVVRPHPVDVDGFDPAGLSADIRAVAITPSRQFPLGMTLPLARRLGLLHWASGGDRWVIEDDYDGEYRYRGQPLQAMMSLDEVGCVIYAGSFSKVMFQGLRLGYLVVPQSLVAGVGAVVTRRGTRAGLVPQPALARFISQGLFATHLRRMRRRYAERQQALLGAIAETCAGLLEAEDEPSGMHLVANLTQELTTRMDDNSASALCRSVGVNARPLSGFYAGEPSRQGLVLGFAGFDKAEIWRAATAMATALRA